MLTDENVDISPVKNGGGGGGGGGDLIEYCNWSSSWVSNL